MNKIIFIHGWACDASVFDILLPKIDTSNVCCINYANNYDFESQLVKEIQAHKNSHIFAWSMGGMIVLNNWQQIKSHIKTLNLISVPDKFCGKHNHTTMRLEQMITSLTNNPKKELKRFWLNAGVKRLYSSAIKLDFDWLKHSLIYLSQFDAYPMVKNIAVPTNILQGQMDNICLPQAGKALHQLIPQSKLNIFQNSKHAPFIDTEEEFLRFYTNII